MILYNYCGRLLAIGNGRGGGGKTTVTISLASVLARHREALRVGVIDLDPQASASNYLGARAVSDPLVAPPVTVHGIQLFQGGQALHSASARDIAEHLRRASAGVDILLADLPPALAHPTHAAVLKHPDARLLIVPQLEPGALLPAQRLAAMAREAGVPFYVLGNGVDRRRSITSAVATGLFGMYPEEMLPIVLPNAAVAMEAILAKKPLVVHRPKAPLAHAFSIVADVLLLAGGLR